MHSLIKVILLSLFSSFLTLSLASAETPRPNIVFLLSDDQAWTDYGFMGHKEIKTPNLDKLAKQGLTFERGYVAAPICRPSLASIVTGVSPTKHGIVGNDANQKTNRAENDPPFRDAFHQLPSFVKSLTANGYLTHQSGKWWEGTYQEGGFTHGMTHADPKRKGRHGDAGLTIGRDGIKPVTDFIDFAVEEKKPFLVWYAPFLPHTPHNPPARLLEKYTANGIPLDVAKYYAMCEWFDETCGQVINYIDIKNLTENTVFIYACDNGWANASTNADDPTQKDWKHYAQRSKSSPYENGVRTPIMVTWPAKIEPLNSKDLAHTVDIFPTIMSVAGIPTPAGLEGIDLTDPKARAARTTVFGVSHSSHNMTLGKPNETLQYLWCVHGDWKLLVRKNGIDTTQYIKLHQWDKEPFRLYNLSDDPHETNNLAAKYPDKVKALNKEIEAWHASNQK
ncbi:MAG: sulfatase-like hydrolase/transferase [Akkermansiaceae bacterium]